MISMQAIIAPFMKKAFFLQPGLSGVCGALSYSLETHPTKEEPEFAQFMFSVPYNLQLTNAYFAVGVSEVSCLFHVT